VETAPSATTTVAQPEAAPVAVTTTAPAHTQAAAPAHPVVRTSHAARTHTTPAATTSATNTTTTAATTTTPPRIVTISDDFSGDQIDGTIWYRIYQGSGWTLAPNDGQLEFAFPPGTTPGGQYDNYGGHVGTLCTFPDDFDARVDFTLSEWPAANGIVVSLWAFFKPNNLGWEAWRHSSPQWGEQYGGYVGVGNGGSVTLDDTSGTLRLARESGVVTAYFLHKGQWLSLGSAENSAPTAIAVGAGSAQSPPVRADEAVVDFDNFTITAADPSCPPGAQGSG